MTDTGDDLQELVDMLIGLAAKHKFGYPEAARWAQRKLHIPWSALEPAVESINRELRSAQAVQAAVVKGSSYAGQAWYLDAPTDGQWTKYFGKLQAKQAPGLESLAEETKSITGLLTNPHRLGEKRKGLVMGNVQSGKTRNFAGVIARAADAGYKLVIVLAGIHNNLREQTQARLDKDLFQDPWYRITSVEEDFIGVNNLGLLLEKQDFVSAVVKKNTAPLGKLIKALANLPESVRQTYPVLIIDDEADQATPNSATAQAEVSAINQHLRDLWKLVGTGTYVAYTATPFANVLIDPEEPDDLFPDDFLTTISTGEGYFGAEQVFGITEWINEDGSAVAHGLDMVREIPMAEAESLKPSSNKEKRLDEDPEAPDSLINAVEWFVVATAIRRARGQLDHSSMLVHITHYTDPHFAMQSRIRDLIAEMHAQVREGDHERFEAAWGREVGRVQLEDISPQPWEAIEPHIVQVLSDIAVIVDNGQSPDRLNYGDEAKTVIAVGGGTLSRGLTLEGLVVSYFTRTSNAYDTLLQMGRWFGYRPGYGDLPRIWVAPGLAEDYAFLAMVERDLRAEIGSFKGSAHSPREMGVKVRTHPGRLSVTADNKMKAAKVVQLGFNGVLRQVYILDASDPAIADQNRQTIEELLSGQDLEQVGWAPSRLMAQRVPGDRVSAFVTNFKAHSGHKWLTDTGESSSLAAWIANHASGPVWNVLVMGNSSPGPEIEVAGERVRGLNRNPLRKRTTFPSTVDLGAVTSQTDRIADIDPNLYDGRATNKDEDRRRIRRELGNGQGLLIIYPIAGFNEHSKPREDDGESHRMPMLVDHHQWAFAIVGPYVDDSSGANDEYVAVRATWDMTETAEDEDEIASLEREKEEA